MKNSVLITKTITPRQVNNTIEYLESSFKISRMKLQTVIIKLKLEMPCILDTTESVSYLIG